jgi:hypothetical protein
VAELLLQQEGCVLPGCATLAGASSARLRAAKGVWNRWGGGCSCCASWLFGAVVGVVSHTA